MHRLLNRLTRALLRERPADVLAFTGRWAGSAEAQVRAGPAPPLPGQGQGARQIVADV